MQQASPKFGIFICLTCAGTHRGLGVHISFVRSITMDAFKTNEILRMDKGGNKAWRSFFEEHATTKLSGVDWEGSTIAERYGGEVGEEWKERLTARVEDREYVPGEKQEKTTSAAASRTATPLGQAKGISPQSVGPSSLRDSSPFIPSPGSGGRKTQNEAYFAKLGSENANRPGDLPPSQGGKYAGFGSSPAVEPEGSRGAGAGAGAGAGGALPGLDDLQKDPLAAVSKGFGWFASAVGKGAKSVNDDFIVPTAQKLAEADITSTARTHATTLGQTLQAGTKGAADTFSRFVEGDDGPRPRGRGQVPIDESKKDFWDSFGGAGPTAAAAPDPPKPSAIGTAAMRKGGGGGGGGGGGKGKAGKDEEWENENW
ncbi:MAG: Zn finger-containing GTPase- Activating Protein for ARF [Thelocarpon superellum]|nr:MAG: Zn finger-containing GTPase- Activating Protein for ARF [Thelocarpon superellum]